jgi:hypothetical protein
MRSRQIPVACPPTGKVHRREPLRLVPHCGSVDVEAHSAHFEIGNGNIDAGVAKPRGQRADVRSYAFPEPILCRCVRRKRLRLHPRATHFHSNAMPLGLLARFLNF